LHSARSHKEDACAVPPLRLSAAIRKPRARKSSPTAHSRSLHSARSHKQDACAVPAAAHPPSLAFNPPTDSSNSGSNCGSNSDSNSDSGSNSNSTCRAGAPAEQDLQSRSGSNSVLAVLTHRARHCHMRTRPCGIGRGPRGACRSWIVPGPGQSSRPCVSLIALQRDVSPRRLSDRSSPRFG
jgi:hypothetical protein